jgi:hypothetical protein
MHHVRVVMHKLAFLIGAAFFLVSILFIPTSPAPIAKAYSCSSTASGTAVHGSAKGGTASSSVSGSTGSCATSSSSTGTPTHQGSGGSAGCVPLSPPNCDSQIGSPNVFASSSSSAGGSQSSCSNSESNSNLALSNAQSQKGKCVIGFG